MIGVSAIEALATETPHLLEPIWPEHPCYVAPGAYRVFALDATNWALMMMPGVLMEKHRALGTLIQVAEGEQKTVMVQAAKIPLE